MKSVWQEDGADKAVTAPLSLIVSAFAPVRDVRKTLTPQLQTDAGETALLLIDLGQGRNRLGGSALAQVYKQVGSVAPDVDDADLLKGLFGAIQALNNENLLLAYHDRSDGGLLACVCEMAFAGHAGVSVDLSDCGDDPVAALFAEELGAVVQLRATDRVAVMAVLNEHGLGDAVHVIGELNTDDKVEFSAHGTTLLSETRVDLQRAWSETTYRMQTLRDNPACAQQEFDALLDTADRGISPGVSFDAQQDIAAPFIASGVRPRMAILREQGVNGQIEMAAAFHRAGFDAVDVHMSDLLSGRMKLDDFRGLVACGGFSYGDVLGAGQGWAKSVLFHAELRDSFHAFFERGDSFALGVCNGCQMLSTLKEIIPGAQHWPRFARNESEQFEARFSQLEILPTPSIFFSDMAGSILPVAVAHGEGRADFGAENPAGVLDSGLVMARYVDGHGKATESYPANPNGSPLGITGLTTADGRITIMMPHPERVFRTLTNSWHPAEWGEDGPWLRMFRNARAWVG
jgi:phosphoribosylformylglycinamidine synthase